MSLAQWRHFEIAIADFLRALGPTASVTHDAMIPDEHTGEPRQRDVWIEATLLSLFPVKLLVSCKHYGRALHQQDMDHFNGEFISSGAHKGVIYSLSGFNDLAIAKAKVLGFCCCQFYENSPADLPELLTFPTFCMTPRIRLACTEMHGIPGAATWHDVFEIRSGEQNRTVLETLCMSFAELEDTATNKVLSTRRFPAPWAARLELASSDNGRVRLAIEYGESWRIYRGNVDAHLLNGSYNVTTGQFVGSQSSPLIDMEGPDPGPGWTLIEEPPVFADDQKWCLCILSADFRKNLVRAFSAAPLRNADE